MFTVYDRHALAVSREQRPQRRVEDGVTMLLPWIPQRQKQRQYGPSSIVYAGDIHQKALPRYIAAISVQARLN